MIIDNFNPKIYNFDLLFQAPEHHSNNKKYTVHNKTARQSSQRRCRKHCFSRPLAALPGCLPDNLIYVITSLYMQIF